MGFGLADLSNAYVQNFICQQRQENEKGNPYEFGGILAQKGMEAVQGLQKAEEKELQEEVQLTKEQEMELFQREFWKEVAAIPKTSTIDHLVINITDKGWERMKEEPEYRKQMMELIRRDTTGSFIFQVDSVITIGATDKEYRASSWSSGSDEFRNKVKDDSYIEARKKRKKELKEYYEKLWLKHFYEQRKLQSDSFQDVAVRTIQQHQIEETAEAQPISLEERLKAKYPGLVYRVFDAAVVIGGRGMAGSGVKF